MWTFCSFYVRPNLVQKTSYNRNVNWPLAFKMHDQLGTPCDPQSGCGLTYLSCFQAHSAETRISPVRHKLTGIQWYFPFSKYKHRCGASQNAGRSNREKPRTGASCQHERLIFSFLITLFLWLHLHQEEAAKLLCDIQILEIFSR